MDLETRIALLQPQFQVGTLKHLLEEAREDLSNLMRQVQNEALERAAHAARAETLQGEVTRLQEEIRLLKESPGK